MTITQQTAIADIATAIPSSVRVFARHHIDFCCGGKRPLAAVCDERGLSFGEVVGAIEAGAAAPGAPRDWTAAPLGELIDHIVSTYHDVLREELPRLTEMAAKVLKVHGPKDPAVLARLAGITRELEADLTAHMWKEEQVLFPAIRALAAGGGGTMPLDGPIAVMEQEHDRAGALLAEINVITSGHAVPAWACATARALYQGLADLESSMHLHVHLENNVLFPRALRSLATAAGPDKVQPTA